ncbi:hypothetical protein BDV18DRAFT_136104 [Aspergillus unguis]
MAIQHSCVTITTWQTPGSSSTAGRDAFGTDDPCCHSPTTQFDRQSIFKSSTSPSRESHILVVSVD